MNNTNTGGPAFPIDRQTAHGIAVHEVGTTNEAEYIKAVARLSHGMTLRDYFAAKAMQSIYAANVEWKPTGTPMDEESLQLLADVAQDAYKMADAMLKARGA
jgi:hypothetical protein